jgi:multimeric flavodoxin WrbA
MSAQKILIINGSPRRKGNSAVLAEQLAEGARAEGAEVETVLLQDLDIAPCDGCDACRRSGGVCHIDDDMQALYPKVREADALVLAGPVYFFTVTAQTKLFMDRCYSIVRDGDNALAGKRVGILLTYGGNDAFGSGAVNALRTFQDCYGYVKARIVGSVHGTASAAGEIRDNANLMERAARLGRRLAMAD